MSQFSIHSNLNPASKKLYPYLINVQASLLNNLETRLVIPLSLKSKFANKPIKILNPIIHIDNHEYIILTQQMAAIQTKNLGALIYDGSSYRQEIISAIDFMITGF